MVGIKCVKKTELHIDLGLKEPATLEIVGKDLKKVFEIDKDGRVFWLKDGKLTQAKMDKDLSLAFMASVLGTSGFEFPELMEKIRKG